VINDTTSFAPEYDRPERCLSRETARCVVISLDGRYRPLQAATGRYRAMGIAPSVNRRREEEGDGGWWRTRNKRERKRERENVIGELYAGTQGFCHVASCRVESRAIIVHPSRQTTDPSRRFEIFLCRTTLVAQVCAGRGRRPPQHWPRLGAIRICFARGTFSSPTKLLHFTSSKSPLFSISILLCPFLSECLICTVNLGSNSFSNSKNLIKMKSKVNRD